MGPYCQFCDHRCFVDNPHRDSRCTILATCTKGQEHDKKMLGYCWGDFTPHPYRLGVGHRLAEGHDSAACTGCAYDRGYRDGLAAFDDGDLDRTTDLSGESVTA